MSNNNRAPCAPITNSLRISRKRLCLPKSQIIRSTWLEFSKRTDCVKNPVPMRDFDYSINNSELYHFRKLIFPTPPSPELIISNIYSNRILLVFCITVSRLWF